MRRTLSSIVVDASTLANTWNVEFRPEKRGYRIWLTSSQTMPAICIDKNQTKLSWRKAAEFLHGLCENGLAGDWREDIQVTGVDGASWKAEVVAMAAITEESPTYGATDLLLDLPDKDIAFLSTRLGCLWSDQSLSVLDAIRDSVSLQHSGCDLAALLTEIGCTVESDGPALIKASADYWERSKQVEQAEALRYSNEPKTLEQYLATCNYDLQVMDLEKCVEFSPPASDDVVFRLLDAWTHSRRKPQAGVIANVHWGNEIAWIPWLLKGTDEKVLVRYAKHNAKGAARVSSWLQKRAHKVALAIAKNEEKSLGQAWGIGQNMYRSFVRFVNAYVPISE